MSGIGEDVMTAKSSSNFIANILLVIVVVTHVLGVVFFRALAPANTPEGLSTLEAIFAIFYWYTFIVVICLVSVFYRVKHITKLKAKFKSLDIVIAVITLMPVFVYIYVMYENLS